MVLASSVVCEAGLYLFWEQVTRLVLCTVKGEVGSVVTGKCGCWGLTPAEPLPCLPPGRCAKTPGLRRRQLIAKQKLSVQARQKNSLCPVCDKGRQVFSHFRN